MSSEKNVLEDSDRDIEEEIPQSRVIKIGDLGKVVTGGTPSTKQEDNYGGDYPFIRVSDFDSDPFVEDTGKKLTEKGRTEVENKEIPEGAVMVSCIGTGLGKTALATEKCVTNQQINSIIPEEKFDNWYIYYKLTANRKLLQKYAGGSAQPIISKSRFSDIEIEVQTYETQRKIGKILSEFDKKIRLNNRINDILEEIAQSLFKSWFVDFDQYNEFKQSDLGEIPKSFDIGKLDDKIWSGRGYSYTSEFLDKENELDDNYPMINLKNVREGGGFRNDGYKYYTEESMKDRYKIESGDLILAITDLTQEGRVIGSPALIPNLNAKMNIISQDVAKIIPEEVPKEFLYHLFRSKQFQDYSKSVATGTTVLHLSLTSIGEFEFVIPPESKMNEFAEIARTIHKKKHETINENNNLRVLRDTLIPKLMSGEIRVDNIDLDELRSGNEE